MATFEVEITNLQGTVLATPVNFKDLKIEWPISDVRTASFSLSLYDPAVAQLRSIDGQGKLWGALSRMVRIRYRGHLLFWGIITEPKARASGKRIQVNAADPIYRLMRRQLNYGDSVVGPSDGPAPQNPSDFTTMRAIYQASFNTEDQYDAGIPDIGIFNGSNSAIAAPDGYWTTCERGANVFDKFQEVGRSATGAEWTLGVREPEEDDVPFNSIPLTATIDFDQSAPSDPDVTWNLSVDSTAGWLESEGSLRLTYTRAEDGVEVRAIWRYDTTGPGSLQISPGSFHPDAIIAEGTVIKTARGRRPYRYVRLNTYDFMGSNRTGAPIDISPTEVDPPVGDVIVSFLYDDTDPFGTNCRDFEWNPDGDSCANQDVGVMTSNDPDSRGLRAICRNVNSWLHAGIYSKWDSVGGANVGDVSQSNLTGHSAAEVERYGRPPNFFKPYLRTEPAEGLPAVGEWGGRPMFLRDFFLGDRVLARYRQGYLDTGVMIGRIMKVTIGQADAAGNVNIDLDCVPHVVDLDEVTCTPAWVPA